MFLCLEQGGCSKLWFSAAILCSCGRGHTLVRYALHKSNDQSHSKQRVICANIGEWLHKCDSEIPYWVCLPNVHIRVSGVTINVHGA